MENRHRKQTTRLCSSKCHGPTAPRQRPAGDRVGNKPDPRSVLSFPTGSKPCQAPSLREVCGLETPSSHMVSGLGSQGAAQTAGLGHMTMPPCPRIFLHSASPLKALKQSPKNYRLLKPQECRPIAGNHSSILLSSH